MTGIFFRIQQNLFGVFSSVFSFFVHKQIAGFFTLEIYSPSLDFTLSVPKTPTFDPFEEKQ